MNSPPGKMRIGLLWHSMNSDNMGVGALTLSHIAMIQAIARDISVTPSFIVLSWTDPRPPYYVRDGVSVSSLRMRDFIRPMGGLYSVLRNCDIVLDIGAGDSFADIYGARRIGTQLASKLLVLLTRRPLVLCPQTIGPFNRSYWRHAALALITRSRVVSTRDDLSTGFLRKIGYRGHVVEATDLAMKLPFNRPDCGDRRLVKVGLNVSGLLFNGGYTKSNMFGLAANYPELVRAIIVHFSALKGIELHLVSHVISDHIEVEDDYRVSQMLADEYPGIVLAPKFNDPIAVKSYISGLDFFMGSRMHACVAAFSSGVPVLPIAYSRKFAGLFGTLGYDLTADCRTEGTKAILARAKLAFENRDELKIKMDAAYARGLVRLGAYETALRGALQSAIS